MKKFITLISLFTIFITASSVLVPAYASASLFDGSKQAACDGVEQSVSGAGRCDANVAASSVNTKIAVVINIISIVVGVAAIIMIIISGLKYITSAGDSAKVNSAKDTILYAIIGLVIVAMAQIIVKFVLKQATKPAPTPASSSSQTIGGKVDGKVK